MIDTEHVALNVAKSEEIAGRLRALGLREGDVAGHLGVDLGDLYASVDRYRALIDQLLATPVDQREQVSDLLIDLSGELRHLGYHAESGLSSVDALAEEFDGAD